VATSGIERPSQAEAWHGITRTEEARVPSRSEVSKEQEEARRSGGSVATSLLLVLTADCKARNVPRFASPSAAEASESERPFQ
jgi:hypothetical protein